MLEYLRAKLIWDVSYLDLLLNTPPAKLPSIMLECLLVCFQVAHHAFFKFAIRGNYLWNVVSRSPGLKKKKKKKEETEQDNQYSKASRSLKGPFVWNIWALQKALHWLLGMSYFLFFYFYNAQTVVGFSRDRQALRLTVVHSTLMPRATLRSIGPSLHRSNVVQLHVRLNSLQMQPVSKTCTVLVTVLKNWNTVRTWVPTILRTSPFWIGWSSPLPNASFSGRIRIKLWMRCWKRNVQILITFPLRLLFSS